MYVCRRVIFYVRVPVCVCARALYPVNNLDFVQSTVISEFNTALFQVIVTDTAYVL